MQNFIKNNLCKVSRRRARDRYRNSSRPRPRRDQRPSRPSLQKRVSRRVSRPRPSLETPSLVSRVAISAGQNISDVVETVTSETETWLKLRDRDFAIKAETRAETWKFETETSDFTDGN